MPASDPRLAIRPCLGPEEYPRLVGIWRSAVRATHGFLAEEDFVRIESLLAPAYFPNVTLTVAERAGEPVGFAGVSAPEAGSGAGLEMLFVANAARGTGVGSALLAEVVERQGVTRVDVNEQNPGAHGFYRSRGFAQVGRSALDGDGRPYPILHLELPARAVRG
ncbi:GNAT family N-acetyltransferase [Leucobacter zeae]|nr:GNAT family N-acetyltransferase [Leucobacter zeae]